MTTMFQHVMLAVKLGGVAYGIELSEEGYKAVLEEANSVSKNQRLQLFPMPNQQLFEVAFQDKALPPMQETLDKPARVRGVVFGTGVKIMTVIKAAQRCFEEYVPENAPGIREEILRGLAKTEDRRMLEYLMQQFNVEEWNCERCGYSESTSECDSADLLRRYLAGDKVAFGDSRQLPEWPEDRGEFPQKGLGK